MNIRSLAAALILHLALASTLGQRLLVDEFDAPSDPRDMGQKVGDPGALIPNSSVVQVTGVLGGSRKLQVVSTGAGKLWLFVNYYPGGDTLFFRTEPGPGIATVTYDSNGTGLGDLNLTVAAPGRGSRHDAIRILVRSVSLGSGDTIDGLVRMTDGLGIAEGRFVVTSTRPSPKEFTIPFSAFSTNGIGNPFGSLDTLTIQLIPAVPDKFQGYHEISLERIEFVNTGSGSSIVIGGSVATVAAIVVYAAWILANRRRRPPRPPPPTPR